MKIAVLIPCFNEEVTIQKVVHDFRQQLPTATVYVYDNNSSDKTAAIAAAEGAVVVQEKRQGKGFVMASMFENIEADVFVLVDGDDTYPADKVHDLIRPLVEEKADMTVGTRLIEYADRSFRPFHVFGNALVVKLVNMVFHSRLTDIMSGYRAFTKAFVKRIPLVSKGFEVETQMTLQALYYDFVIAEVPVAYRTRPEGSHSKLKTFSDGTKVLLKIVDIFKSYRPLLFFSAIALFLCLLGLLIGSVPIAEFLQTGMVSHLPSAVLASGVMVIAVISFTIGVILDSMNHRLRELMRMVSLTPFPRVVAGSFQRSVMAGPEVAGLLSAGSDIQPCIAAGNPIHAEIGVGEDGRQVCAVALDEVPQVLQAYGVFHVDESVVVLDDHEMSGADPFEVIH